MQDGYFHVIAEPVSTCVQEIFDRAPRQSPRWRPGCACTSGSGAPAALRAGPPPKDESKGETQGASNEEPQKVAAREVPSSDAVVGGSTD